MINSVLAMFNIAAFSFAFIAWRSPKWKFKMGYKLQASALADEARKQRYQDLLNEFKKSEDAA